MPFILRFETALVQHSEGAEAARARRHADENFAERGDGWLEFWTNPSVLTPVNDQVPAVCRGTIAT
jgi:hypothetical protein